MLEVLFGLVVVFALYAIANYLDDIRGELRAIRQRLDSAPSTRQRTERRGESSG